MRPARATAPCTVGNFGPGFDVLSLALAREGDTVEISIGERDEITIEGPGADRIPREWTRNAACAALDLLRQRVRRTDPLRVHITKGMPPGSGLGSSASSSAAAVRAFLGLHNVTIDPTTALDAAAAGEAVASGGAHRDDVGAALFGGIVIVGGDGPDAVIRLRPPPLHLVVARQDVELATKEMRRLIPDQLPRASVVRNLSNVARIVHACHAGDAAMLCRALDDRISKPYRSPRVPQFAGLERAAREAGADAFLLSGSGPAVIAACVSQDAAGQVEKAMRALVERGEVFVTQPLAEVTGPGLRLHGV